MARDLGPCCRKCRREGIKLMLKGNRCESAKCPMEKPSRNAPPGGAKAFRRRQSSEYGKRLRETQKVKRYYGLFDRQFRTCFRKAQRSRENTGEVLLSLLERRLDNVVCKLGYAPSRKAARVEIGHGHFTVNDARVDKPGYLVSVGDRIGVRKREASQKIVRSQLELDPNRLVQPWLKLDDKAMEGGIVAMPTRDDVQIPVEEQLVIEFCSR
ncbi:MAG: 30S ribosomal protein S4 [Phycisphaerae bacterium]|nr:30S ribosomal protein S4 [Phycisphaerae bacterium]